MKRSVKKYAKRGASVRKPLRLADGGFVQDKGKDEEDSVGEFMTEVLRPLYGVKMRIPENARMSENIEDTRGDAAIYNNKLAMQKTRGPRSEYVRDEFQTPKKLVTQMDRDVDETIKRSRMNAEKVQPGMTPTEEREVLEKGSSPGYDAWRKRQDLDELMERITREERPSGKDRRGFEDLIEKETRGYAKGGLVKKPRRRGDGICSRGHTKGRMY